MLQLLVSLGMVLLCGGGVVVLALLLGAVFLVMMVWSPQGAEMLAAH